MISIYFVLLFVVLTNANINNVPSTVRIYSDLAEIVQPLTTLPLEFSDDEWNNIRSDSITLLGENLNITLQTITEKKESFNGTEVYIRSPISLDKTTNKLIKGILINELDNLVKIQDQSIAGQQYLYFTVSSDQIYYLKEPTKPKYDVNFTYQSGDSKVFVSYLRSNLNWRTQYQLNLYQNESDLIVMANIRNDGKTFVLIDQAELIGGDINLQAQPQQYQYNRLFRSAKSQSGDMHMESADLVQPTVEQGNELAGLYVFPINKPFKINARTNYLLPMFRPHVSVERYSLISKIFSPISKSGKAQRSYRLTSERYLSQGNCILRENDRIVGEISLPNLAANDKYEFSIGEDADIIYKENVTFVSLDIYNVTEPISKNLLDKDPSSSIVNITRTRSVTAYNITVQFKNLKNHPVDIEYEQKGLQAYLRVEMTSPSGSKVSQDASSMKLNITLEANTTKNWFYTFALFRYV